MRYLFLITLTLACASKPAFKTVTPLSDRSDAAWALQVNNSWGDTLAEGPVQSISNESRTHRFGPCLLMVTAGAVGEDNEALIAWELYDTCKNESVAMGLSND